MIISHRNIFLTVFFPFLMNGSAFSQNDPDFGTWFTFGIEKSFNKKYILGVNQEMRLRENASRLNLFYTNPYFSYKIKKRFKVSLGYRFINKYMYQDKSFSLRHRLMFDASYKQKFGDFSISYRSRIQGEVRDYNCSPMGHFPEYFWRNKFDLSYDIGNFSPYIGTELRYQIHDPKNPESDYGFRRARTYFGTDYELTKKQTLGIFFLYQQEFDIDDPNLGYIFGLEYEISL